MENAQRDVNIAFMNEVAKMFDTMGIDTDQVLEAASTKWNFLPFHPGLVGGHCIGVDSYYLIEKALQHGYHPRLLMEARTVNDSMGVYYATELIRLRKRCQDFNPWICLQAQLCRHPQYQSRGYLQHATLLWH